MKIATGWSIKPDTENAAGEAYETLTEALGGPPQFLLVHGSPLYDAKALVARLRSLAPCTPLHGATSCLGVLTSDGLHSDLGRGLGLFGIYDPDGSYGVGMVDAGQDVKAAARSALDQALHEAGRPGEVPTVILISSFPGEEEHIICAIEDHVGEGVPIFGGTSADNDMSGQWKQFGNDQALSHGVSIAVLFPSGDIGYAFHGGFEPTAHRGRATRVSGRILHEIDHKPAVRVYNEWTQGLIADKLPAGGSLVPTASLSPLGIPVGRVGEIPYFRIGYPVEALPDQSLLLYTDIPPDSEIVLMSGTHDSLATRAGRVAEASIEAAPFPPDRIQGAFILFCTGSMLVIQDRLQESLEGLRAALGNAPFLCTFTLGEQGCFIGGENRHANLMIATLVFGSESE